MELTDREIRSVGFDRYVRQRVWRIVIVGLVLFGLLVLTRWLLHDSLTAGWWWVAALLGLPYGGIVWLFWRAHKAGRRFLAEWKGEQIVESWVAQIPDMVPKDEEASEETRLVLSGLLSRGLICSHDTPGGENGYQLTPKGTQHVRRKVLPLLGSAERALLILMVVEMDEAGA